LETNLQQRRTAIDMSLVVSNLDSVIFAIPLLALLFSAFFRVDELMGRSMKPVASRRAIAGTDQNGMPLCLDPDARRPMRSHKLH
jgi:hypothetical protein